MKVREGSVTVSYAPFTVTVGGKDYTHFRLRYWQDGSLQRPTCKTETEARSLAQKKALELANGQTAASKMSIEDAASMARIKQILQNYGITKPPELFVSEAADALAKLKGKPLPIAIDFYLKHHPETGQKSFSEVVDIFLDRRKPAIRWRQYKDLFDRLNFLKPHFQCAAASLTAMDITQVLTTLQAKRKWSAHTCNQYRAVLSNCLRWSAGKNIIPRDWREMDYVDKQEASVTKKKADSPERVATLIAALPEDMVPAMVIRYFCIIRSSELFGRPNDNIPPLDWQDIFLKSGELKVLEGKVRDAKTRTAQRIVSIPENAVKWLKKYQQPEGPIYHGTEDHYSKRLRKICAKLGMKWNHNAGRRTAASIRDAETQHLEDLSRESGTSRQTMRKHYIDPQLRGTLKKYRSILPQRRTRNIVEFPRQKNAKIKSNTVENKTVRSEENH